MAGPPGIGEALARLLERLVAAHRERHGTLPRQPFDPRWVSPCQVGEPDAEGLIEWRPVPREAPAGLGGLERALETALHPDLATYFGSYWCDSFAARTTEGGLTLIQVWNEADLERLIANQIGHALAKRRSRAPLTLFVALADEDDLILALDNASGAVVLERPGEAPLREVAGSLGELLGRCDPQV